MNESNLNTYAHLHLNNIDMLQASEEQLNVINHIKNGYNISVDAVAGSGKTTTVLSLAHHIPNKCIVQLTYNSELRREVNAKIHKLSDTGVMMLENLTVNTYHSFGYKYYSTESSTDIGICKIISGNLQPRCPLPNIEILVIDEIQDMIPLYYEFVYKLLFDLAKPVQILILGDKYQGLYDFKGADTRFLTLGNNLWPISKYHFKQTELTTSYRVTKQIADFVNRVMLGEERIKATRDGPPVDYIRNINYSAVAHILYCKLKAMLDSGYATPSDIFILTPSLKRSRLYKIIENKLVNDGYPCYVPISDESSITDEVIKNKIIFSSFHQSKGRERKICALLHFDISYFLYYNRCSIADRTTCPPPMYVAATRATHNLIVVETSDPIPFLKYSHVEIKNSSFVNFPAIPLGVMNPPVKELVREYENTTPTDIIRFLPNDLVIELEDMMDPCFLTDEVSLPLNPVKIASYVTSRYHGVELCEEVSEINGLSIPAMYEETYRETNTIKEFVHTHWKQHAYKFKIKHVDYSDKSIGNQLLITNIYNAIKDGLVFKVAQINKDKYDWITPENIRDIHENMKKHIHTPEQLTYEEAISSDIHFKQDIYVEMDEFIQRKCTNIRPVKLRFTGIVDAIDDATIWEFKCVEHLTTEHRLQLVIYAWIWKMLWQPTKGTRVFKLMNIRTGEVQVLDSNSTILDDVVIKLIETKYKTYEVFDDGEFLSNCETTRELYENVEQDDYF